jgi:hypothetical protein
MNQAKQSTNYTFWLKKKKKRIFYFGGYLKYDG